MYTSVYEMFVGNARVHLFDGPENYVRPHYSPEARCSGLFRVLGTMVGHSILQDGIGFSYLSPVCFWSVMNSEEKALEHATVADVGADTVAVIKKVRVNVDIRHLC